MVLGCARGTAAAGRAALPGGSGDQGGVGAGRWRGDPGRCPGCGSWSGRLHGSYLRFPADLPVAGRGWVLRLRVRRFTCEDVSCVRERSSSRSRA
ncbi:transposase family protein [Streptomyces erythrochromogenes]|nr:transposase family protein [Streptomyces erythrochromogenes]WST99029.1 transposase family protein [Streptomyces erythrochromogenes]